MKSKKSAFNQKQTKKVEYFTNHKSLINTALSALDNKIFLVGENSNLSPIKRQP
jgi:hypothetical protein